MKAVADLTKQESDELIRIGQSRHVWIARSPNLKRVILPFVERSNAVKNLVQKGLVVFSYPSQEFAAILMSLNLRQIAVPDLGDQLRKPGNIFESDTEISAEQRHRLEEYKYFLTAAGLERYTSITNSVKPIVN